MTREVTMKDVEDAYLLCGEPVTSHRFTSMISSHIMIVKGFRRETPKVQKELVKSIRPLVDAFSYDFKTAAVNYP